MMAHDQPPAEVGKPVEARGPTLRLVLAYAAFASLWILFSDQAMEWLFSDPADIVLVSTLKGWLFVAVTSLLLYGLIQHLIDQTLALSRRELDAQESLRASEARNRAVTEQANAAIKASEQRFRDIVNTTDGIVWEADASTFQFTFISQKAERLLGFPTDDWLQPGFWVEHLHPDDQGWAPAYCVACTVRLEPHDFKYRFIARDGRTVWHRDGGVRERCTALAARHHGGYHRTLSNGGATAQAGAGGRAKPGKHSHHQLEIRDRVRERGLCAGDRLWP